jgi:hypothetical protein
LTEQSTQQAQAAAEGITSPLTLFLEEERHDDRQAEEALLLSFTADLGFFESIALGVAQASGARVTIVSDAAMTVSDPRAVRRAGRSYVAGLARCTGAFHPKLVVVAGPQRATVAIGSGNATLAGWQANAELWTVVRGDRNAVPALLPDLTSWLRGLPEQTRFSAGVGEALQRVAGGLESFAENADRIQPEVRLVSSLTVAIIEQLPSGPVDELAVCAPFHDPGAVALQALVERLRPRRLLVSYQPGLTELDGPAVAQLVDDVGGEVRIDPQVRYRHGKLIQWEVGGRRHALTGSPNLSGQALLRSQGQGGNCELGVIAPVHGLGVEHDRQVNRPGAFAETCLAIQRVHAAGLRAGANVFVTTANTGQAERLLETLQRLGVEEMAWEPATYYPTPRGRRNERLRPRPSELLPLADRIRRLSPFHAAAWAKLEAHTEAAWVARALAGDWPSQLSEVEPRAGDQGLPLVCRPGLELHTGVAGRYRERHGNLRSDGGQAVLGRALEQGGRSIDAVWFGPDRLPAVAELAARSGDRAGQGVHFTETSVRYLWLDRARRAGPTAASSRRHRRSTG